LIGAAAAALVALPVPQGLPQLTLPAHAGLQATDPVKNPSALLRLALPITNKPIRAIQRDLEAISGDIRVPGKKPLGKVGSRVRAAAAVLEKQGPAIVADFAPDKKATGQAAIADLKKGLSELSAIVEAQDKDSLVAKQQAVLETVGVIEESMVRGFPFDVPSQYANLPQLKGRAVVEMKIKYSEPREDNSTGGTMRLVIDGYNAPVTGGNFVDLVKRGFYNNVEIQRADGFVVQTGKPDGDSEGFVQNGEVRRIPFEVMVEGDKVPVYEETLEDNGRYNEQPRLPFNAYGTLALARAEFDANSGSSQFFFLLKESELTPTGSNLLDGRYAVFGYVTENSEMLRDLAVGDKIVSAKLLGGEQFLQEPK
jgi:cyclophilin family peptidyl-prolyl cis-trans isomerase